MNTIREFTEQTEKTNKLFLELSFETDLDQSKINEIRESYSFPVLDENGKVEKLEEPMETFIKEDSINDSSETYNEDGKNLWTN